jgi:hypothetical protein
MERTTVSLLATLASSGTASLKRTPVADVSMALKSPRISDGASGLGSKVS